MKKYLSALLLWTVLLSGCAGAPEPAPTAPPEAAPVTLWQPGSLPERETGGAVRAYPIENGTGIRAMGSRLLLFTGDSSTTLTLLSGDEGTVEARAQLNFSLDACDPSVQILPDGLSCFDPIRRETLLLDTRLEPVRRVACPLDMTGTPILSPDGSTLYYCTQTALRAWDLRSGLRRLVKQMPGLSLTAVHDSLLQCTAEGKTLLLSAADGRLMWEGKGSLALSLREGGFFAAWNLGAGQQLLYGSDRNAPSLLTPLDLEKGQFLTYRRGAVTIGPQGASCYDLDSGRRESVLTLENLLQAADTSDGFLYLLTRDCLYRWDTGALPSGESAVYTGSTSPDEDRMALCRDYARRIGEKYALEVCIGQEAAEAPPWDYAFTPEPLAAVTEQALFLLDEALRQYPPSVLEETLAHFSGAKISLVRHIAGTAPSGGVDAAAGLQYSSGTETCIALAVGPLLRQSLWHEMYHVMETHLLGTTAAFDRWDRLNPDGFTYGHPSADYLTTDRRAFIDRYAMGSPKEDRARLMEYAMAPGSEALFASPVLQAKLETLCRGIRQAYGLKKSPEEFPWEQYLSKPMAYSP